MDSKPIVVGGTVPFEEEGRYHSFTYERNEADIENLAGEDRRAFSETGNDSFKLSTTIKFDNEPTDNQIECNPTSKKDELAQTEGETVVCQLLDSNLDKEDNDTKEVQPSVVYISHSTVFSELKKKFQNDPRVVHIDRNRLPDIKEDNFLVGFTGSITDMFDPDTNVDIRRNRLPDIKEDNFLVGFTGSITDMFDPDTNVDIRRRTEVIDSEGKKVRFIKMTPTEKRMHGSHSLCTVYKNMKNLHSGAYIRVVHKRIQKGEIYNYREVLAGMDMPKISPAIFCVIENDNNIDFFMEYINPNISLRELRRLGKKLGKSGAYHVINIFSKAVNRIHIGGWIHGDLHEGNILFKKTENGIIIRIIDYQYARKLAGNETYMEYELSMIVEVISNLIKFWIGKDDHLLDIIQGDNWDLLTYTEKVESLIKETAVESAKFEEQNAMNKHELLKELFK